MSRPEAARLRQREMAALAARLDAEHISLGEHDEFLMDTPAIRLRLIEAIRRTRASLVFTHHYEDYNLDHVTAHNLVKHCALLASLPLLPEQGPPLAAHPAVFCVQPHGPIPFFPTHFVDISELEGQKVELLQCHQSQEAAMTQAVGAGFEKLCGRPDAFWADQLGQPGCESAEAFVAMRARGAVKPFGVLP
jgi:LmbE family N-acetylglucosaminyl deacetylase